MELNKDFLKNEQKNSPDLAQYETSAEEQRSLWDAFKINLVEIDQVSAAINYSSPSLKYLPKESRYEFVKKNRVAVNSGRTLFELADEYGLSIKAFTGLFTRGLTLDVGVGSSGLAGELKAKKIDTRLISIDIKVEKLRMLSESDDKLAADATVLPFKNDSVDNIFASYSMPLWSYSPQEVKKSFFEYLRIIKPQGSLHVAPIIGFTLRTPLNKDGNPVGRIVNIRGKQRIIESDPIVIQTLLENETAMIKNLIQLKGNPNYNIVLLSSRVSSDGSQPMSAHIKKLNNYENSN